MRDKRKLKSHFDEMLSVEYEYFHSEDQISVYKKANISNLPSVRNFSAIVDANNHGRIKILHEYMKNWGKLLSNMKGLSSIGIFRQN